MAPAGDPALVPADAGAGGSKTGCLGPAAAPAAGAAGAAAFAAAAAAAAAFLTR